MVKLNRNLVCHIRWRDNKGRDFSNCKQSNFSKTSLITDGMVDLTGSGLRSAEYGVRSTECGLRSADYGVRITEYGVRSADYGVRITEYGVRSTECGVRSADYGVRITEYGLRIADCGLRIVNTCKLLLLLAVFPAGLFNTFDRLINVYKNNYKRNL